MSPPNTGPGVPEWGSSPVCVKRGHRLLWSQVSEAVVLHLKPAVVFHGAKHGQDRSWREVKSEPHGGRRLPDCLTTPLSHPRESSLRTDAYFSSSLLWVGTGRLTFQVVIHGQADSNRVNPHQLPKTSL